MAAKGDAATISVGTVTTGAGGSAAKELGTSRVGSRREAVIAHATKREAVLVVKKR